MPLTKKDFEVLAQHIRSVSSRAWGVGCDDPDWQVVLRVAEALTTTNPRFNKERFLKACQTTDQ